MSELRCELRLGDYRTALADVERVDAVITDPPYGERTHVVQRYEAKGDKHRLAKAAVPIPYARWSPDDVAAFVEFWAPRNRGWFACFTSHDLVPVYERALEAAGLYSFAPIACVQHAMNIRLAGDGPSNWTCWLVVARPRSLRAWGTLPGAYTGPSFDVGENTLDRTKRIVPGGKPLWLMRAIVRDYSRPGDLVCDPCAGGATTLLAARMEGRGAIGAEMDPDTHAKALARLAHMPVERLGQTALFGSEP